MRSGYHPCGQSPRTVTNCYGWRKPRSLPWTYGARLPTLGPLFDQIGQPRHEKLHADVTNTIKNIEVNVMAIRELSSNEVQAVSGGTFCLLGGLFSFKLSLIKSLFSWGSSCSTTTTCAPAPTTCEPALSTCGSTSYSGCR